MSCISTSWGFPRSTPVLTTETLSRKKELQQLLVSFDIPALRRNINSPANLRWLSRNLHINNREHPKLQRAKVLIHMLLKLY